MIARELAEFLPSGLSISVATRDRELTPHGARASAAVVDPDGLHLTVYVPAGSAEPLVADCRVQPNVAVLFVRATDDRACQLKGIFAGARDARPDERAEVERQFDAFLASLEQIGIPRPLTAGWESWPCAALRVRVTDKFDQTPGPGTGGPMP